jgi:ParB-like chromosome segregation protein Spo0J
MSGNLAERAWPADQIERRPVAELIPYARNARKHSPTQIAEIAGSIREWGWTIPVLVDEDGQIIAGHGRVLAAHQRAIADIPTVVARGWSDAQKRAYTIADNEIAMHATSKKELLRVEPADLQAQTFDLEKIGFAPSDALTEAETDELPQALQLEPAREYAVIVCATVDEWERLKVALNLTPVRRGGYKKGSPLDDVGTQRVVRAADFLAMIEKTT